MRSAPTIIVFIFQLLLTRATANRTFSSSSPLQRKSYDVNFLLRHRKCHQDDSNFSSHCYQSWRSRIRQNSLSPYPRNNYECKGNISEMIITRIRGGNMDTTNGQSNLTPSSTATSPSSTPITNKAPFSDDSNQQTLEKENCDDDDDDEAWRKDLPEQLQLRKGIIHRLLIPTGRPQGKKQTEDNDGTDICYLYLLGTAHISKHSCADAKLLMETIQPDVLFVELCSQRLSLLEDQGQEQEQRQQKVENQNDDSSSASVDTKSVKQMVKEVLTSNPGMSKLAALSSVMLTKIQGDYATKLGVSIGGEFQEAYRIAQSQHLGFIQQQQSEQQKIAWERMYNLNNGASSSSSSSSSTSDPNDDDTNQNPSSHGCVVVLGDRPVQLTLLRAWESLSLFQKIKLLLALLYSSFKQPSIDELKEWLDSIMNDPTSDVLSESIKELGEQFPTIEETIIKERDLYMTSKLLQTARHLGDAAAIEKHSSYQKGRSAGGDGTRVRSIVAVVGAGHCPGIIQRMKYVMEDPERNISEILGKLNDVVETKKWKIDNEDSSSEGGLKYLVSQVTTVDM